MPAPENPSKDEPGQIVVSIEEPAAGNTVSLMVLVLSQPAVEVRLRICVPETEKLSNDAPLQIVVSTEEPATGNTMSLMVLVLSQPELVVRLRT